MLCCWIAFFQEQVPTFFQEIVPPYLFLILICFIYVKYSSVNHLVTRLKSSKTRMRTLLITAHPDDECMFFTPTITSLLDDGHQLFLVCLSKGDYYGQGETRKKELLASCGRLGISPSHVTIVDDERFKDGPDNVWKSQDLGERILAVIERVGAESVVTFDEGGVSSHPNHIAIYTAVKALHSQGRLDKISVFTLTSTDLLRKYIAFCDIPFSSIFSLMSFVCSPQQVLIGWQAMMSHKSQLMWFRWLYIGFSRYMYVNTLQEIK